MQHGEQFDRLYLQFLGHFSGCHPGQNSDTIQRRILQYILGQFSAPLASQIVFGAVFQAHHPKPNRESQQNVSMPSLPSLYSFPRSLPCPSSTPSPPLHFYCQVMKHCGPSVRRPTIAIGFPLYFVLLGGLQDGGGTNAAVEAAGSNRKSTSLHSMATAWRGGDS